MNLFKELAYKLNTVHTIQIGDGSGDFKNNRFEFHNNYEFLINRLDWIEQHKSLIRLIPDFMDITKFIKEIIEPAKIDQTVLVHGDMYPENLIHSRTGNIKSIIDPGEFRAFTYYLDLGTLHSARVKYKFGIELFDEFLKTYQKVSKYKINIKYVIIFSIFWELRCYCRLSVEDPIRFKQWFDNSYTDFRERLKYLKYDKNLFH